MAIQDRSTVFATTAAVYQRMSALMGFLSATVLFLGGLALLGGAITEGSILILIGAVLAVTVAGLMRATTRFRHLACDNRSDGETK
jgi:hypothetical protein